MNLQTKKLNSDANLPASPSQGGQTHANLANNDTNQFVDPHKFVGLQRSRGFTLIEVMVTTMLFTILMVIGTGAVLNANALHQRTQKLRAAVDNLGFIMDDMARTMRTGFKYQCGSVLSLASITLLTLTPTPCLGSGNLAIAFNDQEGNLIIYQIKTEETRGIIEKKKIDEMGVVVYEFRTLTIPEINIDEGKSGFTVIGAGVEATIIQLQPRVIIRLSGTVSYKDRTSSFNLQTTVSQRQLE